MSIYTWLDNLDLKELINLWNDPSAPEAIEAIEETSLYYSELAYAILEQGKAGIEFLCEQVKGADTVKISSILYFLPESLSKDQFENLQETFFRYLRDQRSAIVANTVEGLSFRDDSSVFHEAVLALRNHPDPYVRGSVLRFVSRRLPDLATNLLLDSLQDSHYIVRESAIDELGDLEVFEAIPHLLPLLHDAHPHVRQATASVLWQLEAIEAVPHLQLLRNDPDADVRFVVKEVLADLNSLETEVDR